MNYATIAQSLFSSPVQSVKVEGLDESVGQSLRDAGDELAALVVLEDGTQVAFGRAHYALLSGTAGQVARAIDAQVLEGFSHGDRVQIHYKQATLSPIQRAFQGKIGNISGGEKDGRTLLYRVKFSPPIDVPGLSDPVTSDLWAAEFLRRPKANESVDEAGLQDEPPTTSEVLPAMRASLRAHIAHGKTAYRFGRFKPGMRVKWSDETWIVYDANARGGSKFTLMLVSPDYTKMVSGVWPAQLGEGSEQETDESWSDGSPDDVTESAVAMKKLAAMRAGKVVVVDDKTMGEIEDLVDSGEELRSLPNPKQVGIKDRYVAWIGPAHAKAPAPTESVDEAKEMSALGMFAQLEKNILKKIEHLPNTAPVVSQIVNSLSAVRAALKGHETLVGKEAARLFLGATNGHFLASMPPIGRLAKQYGFDVDRISGSVRVESLDEARKKFGAWSVRTQQGSVWLDDEKRKVSYWVSAKHGDLMAHLEGSGDSISLDDLEVTPAAVAFLKSLNLESVTEAELFTDATGAEALAAKLNELPVPYVSATTSTLGGSTAVMVRISFDAKDTWANGIIQNSRMANFSVRPDGTIEQFSRSHKLSEKFRKTKAKSADDVVAKLRAYAAKVLGESEDTRWSVFESMVDPLVRVGMMAHLVESEPLEVVEFSDRYSAMGIPRPDPNTMCRGKCEGTGVVPVKYSVPKPGEVSAVNDPNDPDDAELRRRWEAAEREHPSDDGWHFVKCPTCNGSRLRIKQEGLEEGKVPHWRDLVSELNDLEIERETEVHLEVPKSGTWKLHTGDVTNARSDSYWGAGTIDPGATPEDMRDLARDLLDQVKGHRSYDESVDEGKWRTTKSGHRIYIERGKVTKGNPHLLRAAKREDVDEGATADQWSGWADWTPHERIVFSATVGLKAGYGGDPNFRLNQAARLTGITKDEWDRAFASLKSRGVLNAAGAVSPKVKKDFYANRKGMHPSVSQSTGKTITAWESLDEAKDPATMTAGQINKELDALAKKSEQQTDKMIAAGRGSWKHSDIRTAAGGGDKLAIDYIAVSDRQHELRAEIDARYGPNAPSRLPHGFKPRKKMSEMEDPFEVPLRRSAGGVVMNQQGRLLLRKPTGEFDGYVWTFPKGRIDAGESVRDAALREVLEETGMECRIVRKLGDYRGGTSITTMFVMEPIRRVREHDEETARIAWVLPQAAMKMIEKTRNKIGRGRDLQILADAIGSSDAERPAGQLKGLVSKLRSFFGGGSVDEGDAGKPITVDAAPERAINQMSSDINWKVFRRGILQKVFADNHVTKAVIARTTKPISWPGVEGQPTWAKGSTVIVGYHPRLGPGVIVGRSLHPSLKASSFQGINHYEFEVVGDYDIANPSKSESVQEAALPRSPLTGKSIEQAKQGHAGDYVLTVWRQQASKWGWSLGNPQGGSFATTTEIGSVPKIIQSVLSRSTIKADRVFVIVGNRTGDPMVVASTFWVDANGNMVEHVNEAKKLPDINSDVYRGQSKLAKHNGKVSPLSVNDQSAAGKLLAQRLPDWSKEDHLSAATQHDALAAQAKRDWSKAADAAAQATWGRPFQATDYRVSGIASDEFTTAHKDTLRTLAHKQTAHGLAAAAHRGAAKKRGLAKEDRESDAASLFEMAKLSAGGRRTLLRAYKTEKVDDDQAISERTTTFAWMDDGTVLKKLDVRWKEDAPGVKYGPRTHSYGWKQHGKLASSALATQESLLNALTKQRDKLAQAGWTIEVFNAAQSEDLAAAQ